MKKVGARYGDGLPVNPKYQNAWGSILGQSPHRTPAPGGWSLDKMGGPLLGVKGLVFVGDSGDDLRDFPRVARQRVGYQLHLVQRGQDPSGWSATDAVGPGCCQIQVQVHESGDAYRVSYVASIGDTVYVLHCSQKQGPPTAASDLDLGNRYKLMSELIRMGETR
jgi:phage-related protein